MVDKRATVVWTDANGDSQVRSITTVSGSSGIQTQLQVYSNAVIMSDWEGDLINNAVTPSTSDYLTVKQVAYLTFTDGAGHNAVLPLPAPNTSIFNADGITVSALAIGPLIAACVGSLRTAAGSTVTAFVSGSLGRGYVSGGSTG